jgi:hypothetical protein
MSVSADRPPNAFIRQLPKAELHLHLEGAVEPGTLLELRRRHGDTATLAETEALYRYTDFPSFLMAFKEVSAHLRGPDDFELVTYRLMQQLKENNVLHAEVYVAVGVCLRSLTEWNAGGRVERAISASPCFGFLTPLATLELKTHSECSTWRPSTRTGTSSALESVATSRRLLQSFSAASMHTPRITDCG